MKTNQKNLKIVKIFIIIAGIGLLCGLSWFIGHKNVKQPTTKTNTTAVKTVPQDETPTEPETKVDPNEGYLVVKEWGLRFKVPEGLTDVRYAIHDDEVAFFAKPTGYDVQYRPDYDAFTGESYSHALGVLYKSTSSTQSVIDHHIEGTKIGDYYYYTAWSFSGTATGIGACFDTYGDEESSCESANLVFKLINSGENALLNTIELAL